MFWDALEEDDMIVHPTLGKEIMRDKIRKNLRRDDHLAKIIKIKFNVGQAAYFHSRGSKEGLVQESISRGLGRAIS